MKKPKSEVRPVVLVVHMGGETREYELKQDSIIIGSGPTANVVIEHPSVSSIHAIVKVTIEAATLVDLGSGSGTRLNGKETSEARLCDGDKITFGEIELEVQLPTLSTPAASPLPAARAPQKADDRTLNLAAKTVQQPLEEEVSDTVAMRPAFVALAREEANKSAAANAEFSKRAAREPEEAPPQTEPTAKDDPTTTGVDPLQTKADNIASVFDVAAKPVARTDQTQREESAKNEAEEAAAAEAARKDKERKTAEAAAKKAARKEAEAAKERAQRQAAQAKYAARKESERKEGPARSAAVAEEARPAPARQLATQRQGAAIVRERVELPELNGRLVGVSTGASGISAELLEQALPKGERGSKVQRRVQVGLHWGAELLNVRHFAEGSVCTIGKGAKNDFQIATDGLPPSLEFITADGQVIVPDGAPVEARVIPERGSGSERLDRDGLKVKGRLKPASSPVGATAFRPGVGERVAVRLGAVTLVVQYVTPADAFTTAWNERIDHALAIAALFVGLFALFTFLMALVTPGGDNEAAEELFKNSQRFAKLILKDGQKKPKQAFELSNKDKGTKTKDDAGKVGAKDKQKDVAVSVKGAPQVDPKRSERDRKVALNSGILRALGGGGKNNAVSNVFGPSGLGSGINSALGALKSANTGDAGDTQSFGSRGTGPGASGNSVGIGGIGSGKGVGDPGDFGNVDLGGRARDERSVEGGKTVIGGSLSQEAIKRVLDRAQSQLRYCYEKELQRIADLNGKVTVKFIIGGSGSVQEANVTSTTLQNANAEGCMLRVIQRLRFPAPAGGGLVDVSYPMIYKPLGD